MTRVHMALPRRWHDIEPDLLFDDWDMLPGWCVRAADDLFVGEI